MRKIELPDGFIAMVGDTVKAKATGHRSDQTLAQSKQSLLNTPSDCVERGAGSLEVLAGEDVLFGERAVRITVDQGNIHGTTWRLPNFNCKIVQVITQDGGETTTSMLTSFMPVDPDASLFQINAAYKEMPPSHLVRLQTGVNFPQGKADQAMDQAYVEANH